MRATNAINRGVAQVDIARSHVDLSAQHPGAIDKLTCAHALKQIKVFSFRALAVWAGFARMSKRATIFAHFLSTEIIHVSLALLDQFDCIAVKLFEVIRCPSHLTLPLKAQPLNVPLNSACIFLAFLFGICVVKAQIAVALIVECQTKIQANRLGMTNMQISIRLRWEACDNIGMFTTRQIGLNNIADEVGDGCLCVAAHYFDGSFKARAMILPENLLAQTDEARMTLSADTISCEKNGQI